MMDYIQNHRWYVVHLMSSSLFICVGIFLWSLCNSFNHLIEFFYHVFSTVVTNSVETIAAVFPSFLYMAHKYSGVKVHKIEKMLFVSSVGSLFLSRPFWNYMLQATSKVMLSYLIPSSSPWTTSKTMWSKIIEGNCDPKGKEILSNQNLLLLSYNRQHIQDS